LKLPRTYQWNIALEQPLGSSQSLSLTYVGAIGRDLLRVTDLFNPNPNFSFVSFTENSATSDYHASQARFQQRLSQGLEALASYTFAHSIDSASTDAFANYLNTPGSFANPNIDRGNSDFDIRHGFSAGITYEPPIRGVLRGWSVGAFVLARSAPPDDIVGAEAVAAGAILYPRPDLLPDAPLVLYGSGYPGRKILMRPLCHPRLRGNREIWDAMCCEVSAHFKAMSGCSASSASPRESGFASGPSSSTS
jgi:hypothetical protein